MGGGLPRPDAGIAAIVTSPRMPRERSEGNLLHLQATLSKDPNWNGGDYYDRGGVLETMIQIRTATLKSYGIETRLKDTITDPAQIDAAIREEAARWARGFDANSLIILAKALRGFDVTAQFDRIKAKVLYVLSRTDRLFPPEIAPGVMQGLKAAGVDADYFLLDSAYGHSASGLEAINGRHGCGSSWRAFRALTAASTDIRSALRRGSKPPGSPKQDSRCPQIVRLHAQRHDLAHRGVAQQFIGNPHGNFHRRLGGAFVTVGLVFGPLAVRPAGKTAYFLGAVERGRQMSRILWAASISRSATRQPGPKFLALALGEPPHRPALESRKHRLPRHIFNDPCSIPAPVSGAMAPPARRSSRLTC